jgi:hypothetical protein
MSAALDAGKKYLADLAAGRVVYREKPTAFQHGLITALVADLEKAEETDEAHENDMRALRREQLRADVGDEPISAEFSSDEPRSS